MLNGYTNVPLEWELPGSTTADDRGESRVTVRIATPAGDALHVPVFHAGDGTLRVRFAGPEPGRYMLRTICEDANHADLEGQTTTAELVPYEGDNPLYRHGRLRVADSRRSLEHADGTPFFWLADTWWMGLTTRLDWPAGFQGLVADRVAKGFNTVQIVAGPLPDFDATVATWHPQQANEGGWPWIERAGRDPEAVPTPRDFIRPNPDFYDNADRRLRHLVEAGLMPCIVGMWGYYLPFMGRENAKRHWRNLVARYAAYPVTWCLCGETMMPTYTTPADRRDHIAAEQRRDWSKVGAYLRQLDPYHTLISTHSCTPYGSRDMLDSEECLDLNMLQTGHSAHVSYPATLESITRYRMAEPTMPFLNSEVNYEGIMGGNWHEVQRFCFWTCVLGGACGHTYGAQGMWAMSSRHEPFEGTTFDWGAGYWQDVMHYLGSTQLGLGARFLRHYPWERFQPRDELLPDGRLYTHAAGIPGQVAFYYFPVAYTDDALCGLAGHPVTLGPDEAFTASWFNPRTGRLTPIGAVAPDDHGHWLPPRPSREDWVLVLENHHETSGAE